MYILIHYYSIPAHLILITHTHTSVSTPLFLFVDSVAYRDTHVPASMLSVRTHPSLKHLSSSATC